MIIEVVGKEIEKIKGDFESYLNGLNMVGEISYSQYSELYDEGTKQIQRAYELGKSELEKENAEPKEKKIKGCYFGKDELGNDFFAKCDCVDCQKRVIALLDLRKEYLNKINKESYLNDQLTKAKELLERLLITSCNSDVLNLLPNCSEVLRVRVEAEQFLSEEEK